MHKILEPTQQDEDGLIGVLTHEEVNAMIGDRNPPDDIKKILHSRVIHLVDYKIKPSKQPSLGCDTGSIGLDERIVSKLKEQNIWKFYSYQERAIQHILNKKSVVIEAPTAFGKTMAFLVPIIDLISKTNGNGIRALFVYPTKALGRNQFSKLENIANSVGLRVRIIDGDTDDNARLDIFNNPPEIIVTNFDLLHYEMYMHRYIGRCLKTIQFLVVDEAHVYTGFFGANVHHIIKRLKRLSTNPIQCIASSATLNDSKVFCTDLFGQNMYVIKERGQRADIDFVMMAPALYKIDGEEYSIPINETIVNQALILSNEKSKMLMFSNSRQRVEDIGKLASERKLKLGIHRGGLPKKYLTDLEKKFQSTEIDIIASTPTLELGIDIGDVDSVVSEIAPSNRFIQRVGRAGRKGNRACACLVLRNNDPISHYYMNHPEKYLQDKWIPHIDTSNPNVMVNQLVAMSCDKPLNEDELSSYNAIMANCIDNYLIELIDGKIRPTKKGENSLKKYNIRGIGETIKVFMNDDHKNKNAIDSRELPIALSELHTRAIYRSGGKLYRVKKLEYPQRNRAYVVPYGNPKHKTSSDIIKDVRITSTISSRHCLGIQIRYCNLDVTYTLKSFYMNLGDRGFHSSLNPDFEYTFETKGVELDLSILIESMMSNPIDLNSKDNIKESTSGDDDHIDSNYGINRTIEHLIINASRMVVGASFDDLSTAYDIKNNNLVYIYDSTIGGNGSSNIVYERMEKIIKRAYQIVSECSCEYIGGCPQCTMLHGYNNENLDKRNTWKLLRTMNNLIHN